MSNKGYVKTVAKITAGSAIIMGVTMATNNFTQPKQVRGTENTPQQEAIIRRVDLAEETPDLSAEGDLLSKGDLLAAKRKQPVRQAVSRGSDLSRIRDMQKISNINNKKAVLTEIKEQEIENEEKLVAFKSEEEKAREALIQQAIETERKAEEARKREAERLAKQKKEQENRNRQTIASNQQGTMMSVPAGDRGSYTYMSYSAVTNRSSAQWKVLRQGGNYADNEGFWRNAHGDYFVAMGTYYGKVGDRLEITLQNGTRFNVMLGDMKANQHTVDNNRIHYKDGSVVEFIMDRRGNIPTPMKNGNGHAVPSKSKNLNLQGKIRSIKKLS